MLMMRPPYVLPTPVPKHAKHHEHQRGRPPADAHDARLWGGGGHRWQ